VKGKAVIVHAKADDLTTQPTGDAGDRIGCGVIR
jgi:Cu-Zn family superoxide dismutase